MKYSNTALANATAIQSPAWLLKYGKNAAIGFVALITILILNPFSAVPTGTRGVITQFGAIKGIQGEGLSFVPPWQKLTIFSIRAEEAEIENADGSTADTQPVKVSLTVRYSI